MVESISFLLIYPFNFTVKMCKILNDSTVNQCKHQKKKKKDQQEKVGKRAI